MVGASDLGVLLAAIDARTTWLPLPLTRPPGRRWRPQRSRRALAGGPSVLRAAAGAALAVLLFFLVWLVSRGGIGFGDVRFAPLVGAAAASHSWSVLIWALLLGSLAGAGHGLVRLALRRRVRFRTRRGCWSAPISPGRDLGRLSTEHIQGGPGVRVGRVRLRVGVIGPARPADRHHVATGDGIQRQEVLAEQLAQLVLIVVKELYAPLVSPRSTASSVSVGL